MKKIPYGISDFKLLKTKDYFFIDKTDYISNYLIFLRPRRFGKTLLIAMLETYYDIAFKDEYDFLTIKDRRLDFSLEILNERVKRINKDFLVNKLELI